MLAHQDIPDGSPGPWTCGRGSARDRRRYVALFDRYPRLGAWMRAAAQEPPDYDAMRDVGRALRLLSERELRLLLRMAPLTFQRWILAHAAPRRLGRLRRAMLTRHDLGSWVLSNSAFNKPTLSRFVRRTPARHINRLLPGVLFRHTNDLLEHPDVTTECWAAAARHARGTRRLEALAHRARRAGAEERRVVATLASSLDAQCIVLRPEETDTLVAALLGSLAHEEREAQLELADRLVERGPGLTQDHFRRLLGSPDPQLRARAVRWLGRQTPASGVARVG